ncbi:MAG: glycerophosphodiester phosphodiesterase [Planctomycetota bacterium]|jgi:glycerophosphoryl diester phosphodiesterase
MAESMLILGHRGAPTEAPENTLASFERALAAGADGVECDVRRSWDGELLVHHDAQVGEAQGALDEDDPRLVQLMTGDAVRALLPDTPSLDAVVAAAASAKLLMVEAKMPVGDRDLLLESISDALARFWRAGPGGPPRLTVAQQPHLLAEIHEQAPEEALGVIVARALGAGEWRWVLGLPVQAVVMRDDLLTDARLADIRAAGHRCFAFIVNDPDAARRRRDQGLDGIVTDEPAALCAALRG